MKKIALLLSACALTASVSAQAESSPKSDCAQTDFGAEYQRSVTLAGKSSKASSQVLKLWRVGPEVIHEFPAQKVANRWSLVSNGRLKLTRYFDAYNRAIEYQPSDLNEGKGFTDWDVRYQLISAAYLTGLNMTKASGTGCQRVEHYAGVVNGANVQLDWMPELKLLKRFERKTSQGMEVTELVKTLDDVSKVAHSRDDFVEFGFADIGDNETDPFLSKLISIGFVEHGHSGIYDAQGRALEGPDSHGSHQGHNH